MPCVSKIILAAITNAYFLNSEITQLYHSWVKGKEWIPGLICLIYILALAAEIQLPSRYRNPYRSLQLLGC